MLFKKITLADAVSVYRNYLKREDPDELLVACEDFGNSYAFYSFPKEWDGRDDSLGISNIFTTVNKRTGKIGFVMFGDEPDDPKEIDISEYMTNDELKCREKAEQ